MVYRVTATLTEENDGTFTLAYTGEDGAVLATFSCETEAEAMRIHSEQEHLAAESGATIDHIH